MIDFSRFLFWVAGVAFLLASLLAWQRQTARGLTPQRALTHDSQPITVIIRELNIQLPVYPTSLENEDWLTTSKGISYLVDSAIPGEKGNSIFYGHNWPNLLGALAQAEKGQEIKVLLANGESRRFVITKINLITPDQTHILSSTSEPLLTIYTCTGFLDQKRLMITASPIF